MPMTVEIWSDVVCPFYYIGKREFEAALARFQHKEEIALIRKSFELDPHAPERSEHDMYGMLMSKYGGTRADAEARVQGVVERANRVGLAYRMEQVIIGSSFDAHRLIQLAKTLGKDDVIEERLFRAYFTEGVHLADHTNLVRLAVEAGLPGEEVVAMLVSSRFTEEVRADELEAQRLGIRGVPYFVIDRRYGVSGAQHSDHFLGALEQAWKERHAVK